MAVKQTDIKSDLTISDLVEAINAASVTPIIAPKTFIPDLSDDELRKLAREKLSEALQAIDPATQPGMTRALCAEVKDRLDGKPAQSINMDATLKTITVNATIEIMQPTTELITINNCE